MTSSERLATAATAGGDDPRGTIFTPGSYETISVAAQHLLTHRRVRLDLNQLSHGERLRTVDFFCGILFARQGTVQVVGNHLYLMTI